MRARRPVSPVDKGDKDIYIHVIRATDLNPTHPITTHCLICAGLVLFIVLSYPPDFSVDYRVSTGRGVK